jgi:hypothetical protein
VKVREGAKPPNMAIGSFRGTQSLFHNYFPLMQGITYPYHGEGDKAGSQENRRFFWVLKGGEVKKHD